jgi:hypothetical protein
VQLSVTMVGVRTEIDIFEDDHIEISRFHGDESVEGGRELLTDSAAGLIVRVSAKACI